MTWAVYDVFVMQHFNTQAAAEAMDLWHGISKQNGFFAIHEFAAELQYLYQHRKPGETLHDLYPALLNWCCRQKGKAKIPDSGHLY